MNKIDVKNIEKLIEAREKSLKFDEGGTMTYEEIDKFSTKDLKDLLKDYKKKDKEEFFNIFKVKIDEFFDKYADKEAGEDIIVINACNWWDGDHEPTAIYDELFRSGKAENFFDIIDFYDKDYYEDEEKMFIVGSKKYYDEEDPDEKVWEEYFKIVSGFYYELIDGGYIKPICDYYTKDYNDDKIAHCKYGCYGITKDYEIVAFSVYEDGEVAYKPETIFEF